MRNAVVVLAGALALAALQALIVASVGQGSGSQPVPPPDVFDTLAARGAVQLGLGLALSWVLAAAAVPAMGAWVRRLLPVEPADAGAGIWAAFAFVLLWAAQFLLLAVVAVLYQQLALRVGWPPAFGPGKSIVVGYTLQAGVQLFCIVWIVGLTLRGNGRERPALGLVIGTSPGRQLGAALGALLLFVPCYFATYGVARLVYHVQGIAPQLQQPVQTAMRNVGEPSFFAVVFMAVIAAPLFEELMFRGLLYGAMRRRLTPLGTAIATSLAFAVLHMEPLPLVPLYAFGMLLALLRHYSGSLLAPIVCHALFNATQLGLLLISA